MEEVTLEKEGDIMGSERGTSLAQPPRFDHYDYLSELRFIDDGNPNCFDPEPIDETTSEDPPVGESGLIKVEAEAWSATPQLVLHR